MRPAFEDAAALLLQADRLLRALQPRTSTSFHAQHGLCTGRRYLARFDYPGIVSVLDANTGELIACSEPGQPTKLAKRGAERGRH